MYSTRQEGGDLPSSHRNEGFEVNIISHEYHGDKIIELFDLEPEVSLLWMWRCGWMQSVQEIILHVLCTLYCMFASLDD